MRALFLLFSVFCPLAMAGAAEESTLVHRVFGRASAPAQSSLRPGVLFSTGAASKSELVSSRGVYRVGERAAVEMRPQGLVLRQGVTLVASNPDGLRKTIEVRTSGYRFKVKGTAQIAYDPGHALKIVALEGQVTVALDSLMGEFESLQPGQLLIINPSDHKLPEPVEIDLQRLMATGTLVSGDFGALPTAGRIGTATRGQVLALARGDAWPTSLFLRGLDSALEIERARLAQKVVPRPAERDLVAEERAVFNGIDTLGDPNHVTREQDYLFPSGSIFTNTLTTTTLQQNQENVSRTQVLNVLLVARLNFPPDGDPVPDRNPQIVGTITTDPGLFSGEGQRLNLKVTEGSGLFDRLEVLAPAAITTSPGIDLSLTTPYGVTVSGAKLAAGGDTPDAETLTFAADTKGIELTNSTATGGHISMRSGTTPAQIAISGSTVTANRTLQVGSFSSPAGITVTNSSHLSAILANLDFRTLRSPIVVDANSKLSATAGTITLDAFYRNLRDKKGALVTDPGVVTVRSAELMAQNIRLRGYAKQGDALVIDGAAFNATQLLKLYAEGVSTLRFQNNVSLTAKTSYLAGKTVEVDKNGVVTLTGNGVIYSDTRHYNDQAGTYGSVKATGRLLESSFRRRPRF